MRRFLGPLIIVCFSIVGAGSVNLPAQTPAQSSEQYLPVAGSVGFDVELVQVENGSSKWMASYLSQGKTARFGIEFGPSRPSEEKDATASDIEFGEGSFVAESGSNSSVLLSNLKVALEAKAIPKRVRRVASLPFTFAILGKNHSRSSDGGFTSNPAGNWTAMKIFIGEGKKEGDVFLNLNAAIKKGEFSIKDPDYGEPVLSQLAKVL